MTLSLTLFEQALQAPTMEAVIALSERVQTLEARPDGRVFTVLRDIDHTLAIGSSDNLPASLSNFERRGFELVESRRGTRREERLLLMTLKEIGVQNSYSEGYFDVDAVVLRHLDQLGWPIGRLRIEQSNKQAVERNQRLSNES